MSIVQLDPIDSFVLFITNYIYGVLKIIFFPITLIFFMFSVLKEIDYLDLSGLDG